MRPRAQQLPLIRGVSSSLPRWDQATGTPVPPYGCIHGLENMAKKVFSCLSRELNLSSLQLAHWVVTPLCHRAPDERGLQFELLISQTMQRERNKVKKEFITGARTQAVWSTNRLPYPPGHLLHVSWKWIRTIYYDNGNVCIQLNCGSGSNNWKLAGRSSWQCRSSRS